jgi:hypothetical protein
VYVAEVAQMKEFGGAASFKLRLRRRPLHRSGIVCALHPQISVIHP